MQSIVNTIKGRAIDLAAQMTPVLKESRFRESGMLTPEEFVAAGDHLVATCPTWNWAKGDASYVKTYLPEDKQFLVTRNVPCSKRCRDMEYNSESEKVIEDEGAGEGWVDPYFYAPPTTFKDINKVRPLTGSALIGNSPHKTTNTDFCIVHKTGTSQSQAGGEKDDEDNEDDDDGEAVDMDAFLENLDEDPGAASETVVKQPEEECGVLSTRTYDLNITYDNYYRTPRLWLTGYDEYHQPLRTKELYEDISQDFAKKTVTVEPHPHLDGPPQASVHPCKHAQAMKNLIQTVEDGGGCLEVHMYLIVFLKFVQAVIPTIDYDYTTNFNMS
ncbi:ubiquitin-like-conjugating enzyme ATG3 [Galendromus occidentalis]|uniref:Ubiquitin-like-conjugating enzyme ATG3 n=1 Tax=Galendromus occidentalis TaxID=34638 RepID=A0AAJ7SEP7_9ACAR|nr:ubiquitin-like-conjugating enzyme ATG3 [Galendromus occidentalis]